jgi:hypothetical protein
MFCITSIHALSEDDEGALRSVITISEQPKNTVIQRPGTACRTLYFVE